MNCQVYSSLSTFLLQVVANCFLCVFDVETQSSQRKTVSILHHTQIKQQHFCFKHHVWFSRKNLDHLWHSVWCFALPVLQPAWEIKTADHTRHTSLAYTLSLDLSLMVLERTVTTVLTPHIKTTAQDKNRWVVWLKDEIILRTFCYVHCFLPSHCLYFSLYLPWVAIDCCLFVFPIAMHCNYKANWKNFKGNKQSCD